MAFASFFNAISLWQTGTKYFPSFISNTLGRAVQDTVISLVLCFVCCLAADVKWRMSLPVTFLITLVCALMMAVPSFFVAFILLAMLIVAVW